MPIVKTVADDRPLTIAVDAAALAAVAVQRVRVALPDVGAKRIPRL